MKLKLNIYPIRVYLQFLNLWLKFWLTVQRIKCADIFLTQKRLWAFDGNVAEDAGLVLEALVALPDRTPGAVGRRPDKVWPLRERLKSCGNNITLQTLLVLVWVWFGLAWFRAENGFWEGMYLFVEGLSKLFCMNLKLYSFHQFLTS